MNRKHSWDKVYLNHAPIGSKVMIMKSLESGALVCPAL